MDFLKDLLGGSQGLGGSIFNALLGAATGGFKGRPQWGDMQFMNDATNRLWPDEIRRQGDFLRGLAPSQGAAYNTYQDMTYSQDTARQTDRIQSMSGDLGMSPWELTGSSGAAPLPSPSLGGPSGAPANFMQSLVPLQVASMQNKTALLTAKMQTDTQKYIADQATNNGAMPKAQTGLIATQQEQTAAQAVLTQAQTENTRQGTKTGQAQEALLWSQGAATENDMVLKTVSTLAQFLPKTTVNIGPYKNESIQNYKQLGRLAQELMNKGALGRESEITKKFIDGLSSDQWAEMQSDIMRVSKIALDAAGSAVDQGLKAGGKFLGDMGKGIADFFTK